MRLATPVVAVIGVLLILAPGILASDTQKPMTIDANVATRSRAIFQEPSGVTMESLALAARNRGESAPAAIDFRAIFDQARVRRYEGTWIETHEPGAVFTPTQPTMQYSDSWISNGAVSVLKTGPWGAVVLDLENANLESLEHLELTGLQKNPIMVDSGSASPGDAFNPQERGHWSRNGWHLEIVPQAMGGSFSGAWKVYVSNGALSVMGDNATTLETQDVNEPVDPMGIVWRRHVTWYEVSGAGTGDWSLAPARPNQVIRAFSTSTHIGHFVGMSMDSPQEAIDIPFEPSAGGESLWLRGNFTGGFEPGANGTYHVAVHGPVRAVARGGATPLRLEANVLNASIWTGVALVAWAAVRSLKHASAVGITVWTLFSRLTKDGVTSSPVRQEILSQLQANPGSSLSDLRSRMRSASGTKVASLGLLVHHLRILEHHEKVRAMDAGRSRRFFLTAIPSDEARTQSILMTPRVTDLLLILAESGPLSEKALLATMNKRDEIARTPLRRQLQRLVSHNLVVRSKVGKSFVYAVSAAAAGRLPMVRARDSLQVAEPVAPLASPTA